MLYAHESTASICELLIERHCPRLMLTGGGPIGGEHHAGGENAWVKVRPEQKARMLELAREGRLTATEIAREVGSTQSATFKVIERAGLRARDGRRIVA